MCSILQTKLLIKQMTKSVICTKIKHKHVMCKELITI